MVGGSTTNQSTVSWDFHFVGGKSTTTVNFGGVNFGGVAFRCDFLVIFRRCVEKCGHFVWKM
jgi:hypothetical protein